MSQLNGPISAGLEPIPGYTLRRRLGSGGFGEVWLADAPGGLQKAIKLVYGTLDQERASSELRSLQRIRQVHHPFLLSLERIEVVNQQIVIVTELAECSLVERFQHYRGKGLPGIPRDVLIDFLRDAADALDFLSQKHELQHLDVKPGNLLIVADRIKVADFGLVKDLHEQNQSLVGGLTPTYAAPEIFDGRPDRRSDQYSLAIVYQELLTGQMPFTGRTTAELARQHLSQMPDLESLPPADRPVIARALAKNPLDRFSSCRQLVDQLSRIRAVAVIAPSSNESRDAESKTIATPATASTSTSVGGRQRILPTLDCDVSVNTWMPARCLFIGLGGVGCKSLVQLYSTMKNDLDSIRRVTEHEWLAIDSDSESLDSITDSERSSDCLPAGVATQIQLFKPQEYRTAHPQLFRGISRRWLYNIPRSLKTEGVRPLGMLAFLDHYEQLSRTLQSKLAQLIKGSSDDPYRSSEPLRIYVIGSAHGGTGGGMFTEIGYLVRDIMRELNWRNYRLCGNLSVATTLSANQSEMAAAAAVACCTELVHCMDAESMIPPIHYANASSINNAQRPFDWVNLFDGGLYGSSSEEQNLLASLSEAIWIDSQTMVSSVLSGPRVSANENKVGWLRTIQTTKLRTATPINGTSLSRLCCTESVRKALSYILGPQALNDATSSSPVQCNPTCTGDMPLTSNAAEDIVRRVLVQLHLRYDENTTEEQLLGTWIRRLSDHGREVEAQFAEDLKVVHDWLSAMIQARVLNWRQLEKLQLVLIERIMDLSNVDQSELVIYLAQFDFPGTRAEVISRVSGYLIRFSKECLSLLQRLQKRGRELGKRLRSWNESLLAENSLATGQELPKYEMLDGEWAQVGARVVAVLESTFARLTLQMFAGAVKECEPSEEQESINLPHLLTLSRDLCDRFARDFHIILDQSQTQENDEADHDICLKQIAEFLPTLSQCGGDVYRVLVVPQDQMQSTSEAIHRFGLAETTTLLPSSMARKAFVLTDASNLNLSQLVGTLWRPSHKTFQLAERLLTRVDIEWPNVGNLLIINSSPIEGAAMPAAPAPVESQLNTQQVDVTV